MRFSVPYLVRFVVTTPNKRERSKILNQNVDYELHNLLDFDLPSISGLNIRDGGCDVTEP
jgi:hypothetical protein